MKKITILNVQLYPLPLFQNAADELPPSKGVLGSLPPSLFSLSFDKFFHISSLNIFNIYITAKTPMQFINCNAALGDVDGLAGAICQAMVDRN